MPHWKHSPKLPFWLPVHCQQRVPLSVLPPFSSLQFIFYLTPPAAPPPTRFTRGAHRDLLWSEKVLWLCRSCRGEDSRGSPRSSVSAPAWENAVRTGSPAARLPACACAGETSLAGRITSRGPGGTWGRVGIPTDAWRAQWAAMWVAPSSSWFWAAVDIVTQQLELSAALWVLVVILLSGSIQSFLFSPPHIYWLPVGLCLFPTAVSSLSQDSEDAAIRCDPLWSCISLPLLVAQLSFRCVCWGWMIWMCGAWGCSCKSQTFEILMKMSAGVYMSIRFL